MIRIVLVEDQAMVRGALVALLSLEHDLEVVGEAADSASAIAIARATTPDVVLVDIELPDANGIETVKVLAPELPATRFIMLTTFGRPGYLQAAIEAGATGFLLKDAPSEQLAQSIRRVHAGVRAIDPNLAVAALTLGPNPLTPRQRDVLRLTRIGHSVQVIASELSLSEGTVRNYLSEAIAATSAANRHDAVRVAESRGWLD
ncbi:MAG: response regulator transcription factor [Thermomicrobiales bacterium]|nr:response regulator transcription factor [Thermomicrobiales bacterium]MCO5219631.1 response regulator transcription factor [Thermomicrobiales bacterium]MCO5224704.1 response regulator transcription factor [Thermomicrobiales bacterium]MCO5228822.1 response regulator transcription factor [Thermomicrobiales bacterium]